MRGCDIPQEEAKGNSSFQRTAKAVCAARPGASDCHGEGDGAGEPEDGGDDVEYEGGELVEDARHVDGGNADVGEDEQRPDRVEDHEVNDRRRVARVGVPEPPMVSACDYGQTSQYFKGSAECMRGRTVVPYPVRPSSMMVNTAATA